MSSMAVGHQIERELNTGNRRDVMIASGAISVGLFIALGGTNLLVVDEPHMPIDQKIVNEVTERFDGDKNGTLSSDELSAARLHHSQVLQTVGLLKK